MGNVMFIECKDPW